MAKYTVEGEAPSWSLLLDFPLCNEILPGLWLGGTRDDDTIDVAQNEFDERQITKKDFDFVATLYAWAQPVDWQVKEIRYGFYDADVNDDDLPAILSIARLTHQEWKSGSRVLVRCQAGLNRSSFVMCLVLMLEGYTADAAIALMREKRNEHVLINKQFETFLRSINHLE